MAFQTHVNRYQAPGIPGTFASNNPSYSAVGGENQYVACENGVLIGRFGWTDANGRIANAGGSAPLGFILHSDSTTSVIAPQWLFLLAARSL